MFFFERMERKLTEAMGEGLECNYPLSGIRLDQVVLLMENIKL